MTWQLQPAAQSFKNIRAQWDLLNASLGNHILLDSGFVAPLLRHFGDRGVQLASSTDASNPGVALVVQRGPGRWETFQPAQAPIGLFLPNSLDTTGEGLVLITRALPGYALLFSVLQQDPDYSRFSLQATNGKIQRVDYIQTARISLQGSFEAYWKARGTNLRHNLARRRRRLAEKGFTLELAAIRSAGEIASAIREYGILESQGWKGREGTAIAEGNAQGLFYRDVFEHFCDRGEAVIFQLRLNGRVAASDLCLIRNGMMVVLKTAYDEQFNEFSPAFLMREDALRQLFAEQRVRVLEFYGRVMEWHRRWTDEIRTLYHINCFRHRWVSPLKRFVGRFS